MPRKDIILSLPGFSIKKVSGYNPLIIDVIIETNPAAPPVAAGKSARRLALSGVFAMSLLVIAKPSYGLKLISSSAMLVSVTTTSSFPASINISEQRNVCTTMFFIGTQKAHLNKRWRVTLRWGKQR